MEEPLPGQLPLFEDEEPDPAAEAALPEDERAQRRVDRARARWQRVSRRLRIGDPDELAAWAEYREASDRYWDIIQEGKEQGRR